MWVAWRAHSWAAEMDASRADQPANYFPLALKDGLVGIILC